MRSARPSFDCETVIGCWSYSGSSEMTHGRSGKFQILVRARASKFLMRVSRLVIRRCIPDHMLDLLVLQQSLLNDRMTVGPAKTHSGPTIEVDVQKNVRR